MLAPYATNPKQSKGRLLTEQKFYNSGTYRSPYQHDRDRIIHSRTFRRIKHKTQVFVATTEGDHYRTRLTHSLEVAQIARTIARALRLEEDLTEAIALAHDIGHPPFGHDGENTLNHKMKNYGGFNHNIQTLRQVALLEKQYPDIDGLNLTYETIDGLIKHNGPLKKSLQQHEIIKSLQQQANFQLDEFSCAEAQIAAIADDVAYNNHDIEDGVRAELISLNDLKTIPHLKDILDEINRQYPSADDKMQVRELIRRQITEWVEGILQTTEDNLKKIAVENNIPPTELTVQHIRQARLQTVDFAETHKPTIKQLRKLLRDNVYFAVPERRDNATKILSTLFDAYMQTTPHQLNLPQNIAEADKARYICDYISGMTDGFATAEYRRLTKDTSL